MLFLFYQEGFFLREEKKLKKETTSDKKDAGAEQRATANEYAKNLLLRIRRGEGKKIFPSAEPPRFGQIKTT